MKIHLLTDRTVILIDDRQPTVTIEPRIAGVLHINEEEYSLEPEGSPVPVYLKERGTCRVMFDTEAGIRYKGERTTLKAGVPYSVPDYATGFIPLRLKLDELERSNEALRNELHQVTADLEPDSLGYINIGGYEK